MSYTSSAPSTGGGFVQLLRAEWTKLRSLRSTWVCVALTIGLTVFIAYMTGQGNSTNANDLGKLRIFQVQLVHQSLTGDCSIVAHLAEQDGGPDTKAGLMISGPLTTPKDRGNKAPVLGPEPTYAAIMVTPGHGVMWQAGFEKETAGTAGPAPRWLKLTRHGTQLTGFESTDGVTWTKVGTTTLTGLPGQAMVGMFVTNPSTEVKTVRRSATSTESSPDFTLSTAVFDSVSVTGADGEPVSGSWQNLDTAGPPHELPNDLVAGSFTEDAGRFTVSGAGDLGLLEPPSFGDNDVVRDSLSGILIGFIAMAVIAALFITTEFRRGLIRTTYTATPRRGLVLGAKAVVVGVIAFVTGVAAAVPAFLVAQPLLRENGFKPPAYPLVSLSDGPVIRAVLGSGLALALLAVLALALGALLRSGAAALTLVITLVVLPFIIGPFLTLGGEAWLKRITPGVGLAIQQTRERWDDVISPWGGLAVLCGWVAVALAAAVIQLRRRDA